MSEDQIIGVIAGGCGAACLFRAAQTIIHRPQEDVFVDVALGVSLLILFVKFSFSQG